MFRFSTDGILRYAEHRLCCVCSDVPANQQYGRVSVRETANDSCSPADLFHDPFKTVIGSDLAPVLCREVTNLRQQYRCCFFQFCSGRPDELSLFDGLLISKVIPNRIRMMETINRMENFSFSTISESVKVMAAER